MSWRAILGSLVLAGGHGSRTEPAQERRRLDKEGLWLEGSERCGAGQEEVSGPSGHAFSRLVEREQVVLSLEQHLGRLRSGSSTALFLIGAAGLGKTALVEWLEGFARPMGFVVSRATATPMERSLPFGLVDQVLRGLGGDGDIAGASTGALGRYARLARFTLTLRFLEKSAASAPLVLLLDDLHWSDLDSVDFIGFMCRRIDSVPVLVVGTARPEPAVGFDLARDLMGIPSATLVHLEPLSRAGSDLLVARLLGQEPDALTSERLWQACAGSPLLLQVATALPAGNPGSPPGSGRLQGSSWERSSLILERFADVAGFARAYIDAAAVLGVRFRPVEAARLAGLEDDALAEAHGRLLRSGLLEDLEPGWSRFAHPLFAQALVDSLPGPRRKRLHERAFRVLVDRGAPSALASEQAMAADLVGDQLAIEVTWGAGRDALRRGALVSAELHLANAVKLAGDEAPEDLLLDHVRVLAARVQPSEARRACQQLLDRPGLSIFARSEALRLLGRVAAVQAQPREVERNYEAAVAVLGPGDHERAAEILFDGVLTTLINSPLDWTRWACEQGIQLAEPGSELYAGLNLVRCFISLIGGDASGADTIRAATAGSLLGQPAANQSWAWATSVHMVNASKILEAFDEAGALFEHEYRRAVDAGAPWLMHALAIAYSDALYRLGRPQEGLDLVRKTATLAGYLMRPWHDLAMAVLLIELGHTVEADEHMQVLRQHVAAVPEDCSAPVRLWLGLIESRELLRNGEVAKASERMLEVEATAALTGFREPCIVPWALVAVEAHLGAGRSGAAGHVVDDLEAAAELLPCRWPRAAAMLGRALLAAEASPANKNKAAFEHGAGEVDRLFQQAVGAFDDLPMPIAKAEARFRYGRQLRRDGRLLEARRVLHTALELATATSSEYLARRVREELAAAGGRRQRPGRDPSALSAQEEKVAALASEGWTNARIAAAMYISPKTVEHHLAKVFSKLGMSSRRELMRTWPTRSR